MCRQQDSSPKGTARNRIRKKRGLVVCCEKRQNNTGGGTAVGNHRKGKGDIYRRCIPITKKSVTDGQSAPADGGEKETLVFDVITRGKKKKQKDIIKKTHKQSLCEP